MYVFQFTVLYHIQTHFWHTHQEQCPDLPLQKCVTPYTSVEKGLATSTDQNILYMLPGQGAMRRGTFKACSVPQGRGKGQQRPHQPVTARAPLLRLACRPAPTWHPLKQHDQQCFIEVDMSHRNHVSAHSEQSTKGWGLHTQFAHGLKVMVHFRVVAVQERVLILLPGDLKKLRRTMETKQKTHETKSYSPQQQQSQYTQKVYLSKGLFLSNKVYYPYPVHSILTWKYRRLFKIGPLQWLQSGLMSPELRTNKFNRPPCQDQTCLQWWRVGSFSLELETRHILKKIAFSNHVLSKMRQDQIQCFRLKILFQKDLLVLISSSEKKFCKWWLTELDTKSTAWCSNPPVSVRHCSLSHTCLWALKIWVTYAPWWVARCTEKRNCFWIFVIYRQ